MRGVTSWQETFFHFYFHFNSHASCEAWPDAPKAVSICTFISTHTPHARRDGKFHGISIAFRCISTHTPHARRDFSALKTDKDKLNFNSHASCEAWPEKRPFLCAEKCKFQLTRLMRGVTHVMNGSPVPPTYFNSHASCEAWPSGTQKRFRRQLFQLTRLMRGVTYWTLPPCNYREISTHTPHAKWNCQ